MNGSLNDGIISAINRNVPFLGQNLSLIQSSVRLSPGSTGGPLINCYGQVVGIHTTRLSAGEGIENTGFAIPSATVKQILDQLISQGYVSGRPTLGLSGEGITKFDQHYFHIPQGLYLTDVSPDSDAFAQGIATGDILISLNDQHVTSPADLDLIVNGSAIGDILTALVFRNGQEETFFLMVTEYTG
jgi:serine protease Do